MVIIPVLFKVLVALKSAEMEGSAMFQSREDAGDTVVVVVVVVVAGGTVVVVVVVAGT